MKNACLCAFACDVLNVEFCKVLEQKKIASLEMINFCERTHWNKTPCLKYHRVYVINKHVKLNWNFVCDVTLLSLLPCKVMGEKKMALKMKWLFGLLLTSLVSWNSKKKRKKNFCVFCRETLNCLKNIKQKLMWAKNVAEWNWSWLKIQSKWNGNVL